MIPLRDKNPTERFPFVTIILIMMNIAAFVYELTLGPNLEAFLTQYGVIPAQISKVLHIGTMNPLILLMLLTSIFLHGGWLHLGGNMLYLWVFGDNVEDKLGHLRFLLFYIICGISASALHIYLDPQSTTPTIGASGAISGVLGAYLLMFPKAKVVTLIPLFIFIQMAELPAFLILGLWFVLQFFNGLLSLGYATAGTGGVAWWAHVGGFAAGFVLVLPFRKYR
jgi:membrane associated rhomboid family serine protease